MKAPPPSGQAIWVGQPAWSHFILLWIFTALLGVRCAFLLWNGDWRGAFYPIVGMSLLAALASFFRRSTRYRIGSEAVTRSKGLFGKEEERISFSEIGSVSEEQGPLERVFGIGDVVLSLKDGSSRRLAGLKKPEDLCRMIAGFLQADRR